MSTENTRFILKLIGGRYIKNAVEHIKINEVQLTIQAKSLKVQFENLFSGQKALETIGNEVINKNIDAFKNSIIPEIERAMEKKIKIAANQVFEKAPASFFFPEK